jgi:hypothetical protein
MKVETANTQQFKPFELVITIESKEELDALYNMTQMNLSIPKMVESHHKDIVEAFLDETRYTLIARM